MATLVGAATVPTRMTVEEFLDYPWGDIDAELVEGEVRVTPMPAYGHSVLVQTILFAIRDHIAPRKLGAVYGDGIGYQLPHRAETLRGPDVSFVRAERVPARARMRGVLQFAPDLAVEVLSPGDTYTETDEKLEDFLEAGSRAAWLVDPRRRRVVVFVPGQPRRVYAEDSVLDGAPVLPEFTMPVADVFAGIEPER